ncbi:MAG: tetratricopeptide repeat protein [Candidatus Odinarchaeota archaeon]
MTNLKDVEEILERVKDLKNQGNYEEALKTIENLFEKFPNSEEIKVLLIEILFDYGGYLNDDYAIEYEKARQCFEKITILSPENYRAHYNLGLAYFNLEKVENAKKSFETALKIKPDYKFSLYNLGLIYETLGEYEEALDYYEKVLEIDLDFKYALEARSQIRKILDELKYKKRIN